MIHINQNMISIDYTHAEHSPTIYIKYYMEKQTLPGHALHTHTHTTVAETGYWYYTLLVGMKILWEEDGCQFGFKR